MGWDVLVSSLKSSVLLDEVKVITANDDGTGHFVLEYYSGKDVSTDGDVSGEWALLVNVSTIDSLKDEIY